MEIDPGLAIVGTVAVILAVLGVWGLRARAETRARIASLREASRIEIEIVSPLRTAAMILAAVAPIVFGAPFVAMALGEWGREHALGFTLVVMVLSLAAIAIPMTLGAKWAVVGTIVLEGDRLEIATRSARDVLRLDDAWSMSEAIVPPGQRTEVVVALVQGPTHIAFRYPIGITDTALAPEGRISRPIGALVGPEAVVVHERLRERLAERGRVFDLV